MIKDLLEEIKERTAPLLTKEGIELVDLLINRERGRSILKFLVDKPGGITLDECAHLNQKIGQVLDGQDIIQQRYVLEVSSPGLDRPLVSTKDFTRCLGKLVKIVLHKPLNKQNVWIAFLDEVDEKNIFVRTEKEQRLRIARENISRVRLEVEP